MIRTGKVLGYAVGDYNITQEMENRLESLDIDNVTLEDFEAYLIHHEVEIMAMVHPDEKARYGGRFNRYASLIHSSVLVAKDRNFVPSLLNYIRTWYPEFDNHPKAAGILILVYPGMDAWIRYGCYIDYQEERGPDNSFLASIQYLPKNRVIYETEHAPFEVCGMCHFLGLPADNLQPVIASDWG